MSLEKIFDFDGFPFDYRNKTNFRYIPTIYTSNSNMCKKSQHTVPFFEITPQDVLNITLNRPSGGALSKFLDNCAWFFASLVILKLVTYASFSPKMAKR